MTDATESGPTEPSGLRVMHGMAAERWQVEVHGGRPPDFQNEPLMFGTPQTFVGGEEGLSPVSVPVIYGPVGVRTVEGWAVMEVSEPKSEEEVRAELEANGHTSYGPRHVRTMDIITGWEIDWTGAIIITGMETREDGALVMVSWRLDPYVDDDTDDDAEASA